MKRKIQHDAINNQEDEDSSVYPTYFLSDGAANKEKQKSVENGATRFFNKASINRNDPTRKQNISKTYR